ncbi:hypothetical protein FRC09_019021 [Ceratobasidium sp. 395]|nr:hypothetical protein FRC09_019021 [Ceratobasidium sp. 395]
MIYARNALQLKIWTNSVRLSAISRVSTSRGSSVLSQITPTRPISHSVPVSAQRERSRIYDNFGSGNEDRLELGATPRSRRDFTSSKSLHVARVPQDVTDEEFRSAFSSLKGLVKAELRTTKIPPLVIVFFLGEWDTALNDPLGGFGFLHFENEDVAADAAYQLERDPVRFRGYETKINPYTSKAPGPNQPSHVLHVSGLPLDLQYLELVELLKEKAVNQKSIRFMTSKDLSFVGAVGIAFRDTESAIDAKKSLIGASLGGMELREHNIEFGRPLWDERPTTTLMLIGTPREPRGADWMKGILASIDGVTRYKVVKDPETGDYKGVAIVNCEDIPGAWRILEYFNRKYPAYRVVFISSRVEHEQSSYQLALQKLENQGRERYHRARGQERPREIFQYDPDRDLNLTRPTSYKRFNVDSDQEQKHDRGRGN